MELYHRKPPVKEALWAFYFGFFWFTAFSQFSVSIQNLSVDTKVVKAATIRLL